MFEMFQYLIRFRRAEKIALEKGVFSYANDFLKQAIAGTSWCLYVIAILLIASCFSYLHFQRKRRRVNQQRMREIQQLIERPPPKRRPGAVAREREVYQNVLKTAHSIIYPKEENLKCVIRQTRSGTIYGRFVDSKDESSDN